ncbi:hypothetical protein PVK06_023835 [Gossypium arboreum]|uniref:Uncharacterized protein n=1 Tax=Gossypium arboreum TaxID=29729 RepID=A0ABR0PCG5_GOSAR|nr:hypothetical protein PVK06_023835 [Gossypium arboreum]
MITNCFQLEVSKRIPFRRGKRCIGVVNSILLVSMIYHINMQLLLTDESGLFDLGSQLCLYEEFLTSYNQENQTVDKDLSHDGFLFSDLSVSAAFRSGFELLHFVLLTTGLTEGALCGKAHGLINK